MFEQPFTRDEVRPLKKSDYPLTNKLLVLRPSNMKADWQYPALTQLVIVMPNGSANKYNSFQSNVNLFLPYDNCIQSFHKVSLYGVLLGSVLNADIYNYIESGLYNNRDMLEWIDIKAKLKEMYPSWNS